MLMMKELANKPTDHEADELPAHYSFDYSKARTNRFAPSFAQESVMVVFDPDGAAVFPTVVCFLPPKQID